MEVGFAVLHLKGNFHDRIETLDLLREMICGGVKDQAVRTGEQRFFLGQELRAAAVGVGARRTEKAPATRGFQTLEAYGDILGGFAEGDVEHVR